MTDDSKKAVPAPMPWDAPEAPLIGDAPVTRKFETPFELVEESRPARMPTAQADGPTFVSHSDVSDVTVKFRLDDLLSGTGDTLMLGDPMAVVQTTVVRRTSPSGEAETPTRICIGKDIERYLQPSAVIMKRPDRPRVEHSAFEGFIVATLDAPMTVAELAQAAGLAVADLRIALALLADKGQLKLVEQEAPALVDPAAIGLALVQTPDAAASPWDVPSMETMATPPIMSRSFGPSSLLRQVPGASTSTLSALEQFVFSQLWSPRTPIDLAAATGLGESDLKLALEEMIRRGVIVRDDASKPPSTPPAPAPPAATISAPRKPPPAPAPAPAPAPPATATPTPPPPVIVKAPATPAAASLPRTRSLSGRPDPATDIRVQLSRALGLEEKGDIAGAVAALKQITTQVPNDANAWNRLGVLLARTHDLTGALSALAKAHELSPTDPTIESNHARIAAIANQVRGARARR